MSKDIPIEVLDSLNDEEIEILNGIIEAYLSHANRCDYIQNRKMAEKQKTRDMQKVYLLRKILKNLGGVPIAICNHNFVPADNEVVKGGYICLECGCIR